MSGELHTQRHAATLLLTLHDPARRNALDTSMIAAAVEALNVAESDEGVRAVVLTGAAGHFSVGSDIQRWWRQRQAPGPAAGQSTHDSTQGLHDWIEAIRAFPKPIIAAVEGTASGSGLSLALACDLVVAARDAVLKTQYASLGLSCEGGMSWQLARLLPRQLAQRHLWLDEPLAIDHLHALGVIARVTDHGQALPQALALAEQLAQRASNVLASMKELLNQALRPGMTEQLNRERESFQRALMHPNGAQGLRAAIEQRPPEFK